MDNENIKVLLKSSRTFIEIIKKKRKITKKIMKMKMETKEYEYEFKIYNKYKNKSLYREKLDGKVKWVVEIGDKDYLNYITYKTKKEALKSFSDKN